MIRIALIIGSGLVVLWFSFRSSPDFRTLAIMPRWLAEWADANPNFRTFVPFFILAAAAPFLRPGWSATFRPGSPIGAPGLLLLLLVTELIQWPLPGRTCDYRDVFWGSCGIACGTALGLLLWLLVTGRMRPSGLQSPSDK